MNQYKLDGNDIDTLYGITVYKDSGSRESSDSFLAWPKRKDSLTVDRQDQDGMRIDLNDPKVASREFILKCAIKAANRDDFYQKYNGFRTAVLGAETHTIYSYDLNQTFNVFYKEQQNFKTLSNVNQDNVWATFDVVFGETNPNENMQFVYLVDDQDRYLIA